MRLDLVENGRQRLLQIAAKVVPDRHRLNDDLPGSIELRAALCGRSGHERHPVHQGHQLVVVLRHGSFWEDDQWPPRGR